MAKAAKKLNTFKTFNVLEITCSTGNPVDVMVVKTGLAAHPS